MTVRAFARNPAVHRSIEDEIEHLVALLNLIDGDPDRALRSARG